jgi:hypothetical protein
MRRYGCKHKARVQIPLGYLGYNQGKESISEVWSSSNIGRLPTDLKNMANITEMANTDFALLPHITVGYNIIKCNSFLKDFANLLTLLDGFVLENWTIALYSTAQK